MKRTYSLICVPSSAGAHWPGQEKTPRYLRKAGLVEGLESVGIEVVDYGDLPLVRFRPDREHRDRQNLEAVIEICKRVADQVELSLTDNTKLLVIGGDCTIGLGVLAGFLRRHEDLSLLYFDGHVDLNTPITSSSGILDSMGIAHMIGEQGTVEELSHIGPRFPMMVEEKIVLFGFNPQEINAAERDLLARKRFQRYPVFEVRSNPMHAATEALNYLEKQGNRFLVHLDVDVIDFTDFPVADVPQFSEGLRFQDVLTCLATFTASPNFCGMTITEFNPDHADEEGVLAATFIDGLARALVGKKPAPASK